MKPIIKFITLGCKVNQAESEALAYFSRTNPSPSLPGDSNSAGVCVINTCAVTGKAAMQSRQAIRRAIRENPGAVIVVTGCYAQSDPEVIREIQGVDYVVGQTDKHRIFEILSGRPENRPEPVRQFRTFEKMPAPAIGSRTRPFLKVQDGCDAFCTYCIVPYTRGKSRSLGIEQVMSEFEQLTASGAGEIVLTGIHLGRYGLDLQPRTSLLELLKRIEAHAGLQRIRLSSLESTEITDDLLDFIAGSEHICPHFHVPLQSGDRSVLERMHRPYTPEHFADTIIGIHERFPDAAIGTDILVGFPGETIESFENTAELVRTLPLTYFHVFPFSPRKPAPAAGYPERVPEPEVKRRCDSLREIGKIKKAFFFERMVDKILDVIIEKTFAGDRFRLKGLSSNYIPVYIESSDHYSENTRLRARIISASGDRSVTGMIEAGSGQN